MLLSQSPEDALPVDATTSYPRFASMPTATEPTPPVAPVTSTGPSPGRSPARSSASTDSAAVKPAVPIIIAVLLVMFCGMATNQSAGMRANWL